MLTDHKRKRMVNGICGFRPLSPVSIRLPFSETRYSSLWECPGRRKFAYKTLVAAVYGLTRMDRIPLEFHSIVCETNNWKHAGWIVCDRLNPYIYDILTGEETLENPDEIRVSRSDSKVFLFYKTQRPGRWTCAVTKRLDGEGFLITTYPTDAIKEGERIWLK
jgi:hypothetical protein